jgi:hypothetical protein
MLAVSAPSFAQAKAPDAPFILRGAPMGGVKFQHSVHKDVKCDTCHHAAKPEKATKSATQACGDCHTKTAAAPMKTNFKGAFHDQMAKKGTCADCHTVEAAKGKKAPTKCADCHKKENA